MSAVVVHGRAVRSYAGFVFVFFMIGGAVAASLVEKGALPWLAPLRGMEPLVGIASLVLGLLGTFAVWRRARARTGWVEIDDDEIFFVRQEASLFVPKGQIAGFRDGDSDFVEVARRDGVPIAADFPRLTIPTPSEKDRVAVLAALDAMGLRRLER